jgi:hypothetical protein
LKWYLLDKALSVLSEMLNDFARQVAALLVGKPRRLLFLGLEVLRKLHTQTTSFLRCVDTAIKEMRRLEELLPTHANSLAHTISSEQRMDRLVVQLQPLVVSCINVY